MTAEVIRIFPKSATAIGESGHWFVTTTAYAFAYALMALFIHRKFLSRRPPKLAGLFAVLLAGAWAIVPSIVLFFLNRLSWKSVEGLQLGNVFNVFSLRDDNERNLHLWFACVWLALMLVLNANWFLQQVKNFRPPTRRAARAGIISPHGSRHPTSPPRRRKTRPALRAPDSAGGRERLDRHALRPARGQLD